MIDNRDRSDDSHAVLDEKSRIQKAKKIISILEENYDLINAKVLDIGTGSGYIANELSKVTKEVYSVDVVDERRLKAGYNFKRVSDEKLPFKKEDFDIVISNHVIEHVGDQKMHLNECKRVLKSGGIIYLATPNRVWPYDPHYRDYLLNWMPHRIGEMYLRIVRNSKWDVYPITRLGIRRLAGFEIKIESATVDIIKNPRKYNLDTFKQIQPVVSKIPKPLLKALDFITPTLILILRKN